MIRFSRQHGEVCLASFTKLTGVGTGGPRGRSPPENLNGGGGVSPEKVFIGAECLMRPKFAK